MNSNIKEEIILLPSISQTRPTDSLNERPAYVFHHIMKCGGTSVVRSLEKWFNLKYDYIEGADNCPVSNLNHYLDYKFNLENIYSDTCLVSHFQYNGFFLHQRYPEVFQGGGIQNLYLHKRAIGLNNFFILFRSEKFR